MKGARPLLECQPCCSGESDYAPHSLGRRPHPCRGPLRAASSNRNRLNVKIQRRDFLSQHITAGHAMVTTRQHPTDFMPPPPPLPTKTSSATSPSSETSSSHILTHGDTPSNQDLADPFPSSQNATWTHTPSNLTLLWLLISLPLVLWDTGYVFLRPHSMPGGSFHAPIWTPYALYGTIDHIYGWPAWEKHNGFTAAQASLNVVETVGYGVYLYLVWMYGREVRAKGRGAPKAMEGKGRIGELAQARSVAGRMGAWAVLIGFGTALMTVSKTVLYCKFPSRYSVPRLKLMPGCTVCSCTDGRVERGLFWLRKYWSQ